MLILVLGLFAGLAHAGRRLAGSDACDFVGFEFLNNTSHGNLLSCATELVATPSLNFTVAWAFDERGYVDFLRLGLQLPTEGSAAREAVGGGRQWW